MIRDDLEETATSLSPSGTLCVGCVCPRFSASPSEGSEVGLWHVSGDLTDTVREGWSLLLLLWGCLSLITMLGGGGMDKLAFLLQALLHKSRWGPWIWAEVIASRLATSSVLLLL